MRLLDHLREAIPLLNEAIEDAIEANDRGARDLFEWILAATEDHVDSIEARLHTIREIGFDAYLTEQTPG